MTQPYKVWSLTEFAMEQVLTLPGIAAQLTALLANLQFACTWQGRAEPEMSQWEQWENRYHSRYQDQLEIHYYWVWNCIVKSGPQWSPLTYSLRNHYPTSLGGMKGAEVTCPSRRAQLSLAALPIPAPVIPTQSHRRHWIGYFYVLCKSKTDWQNVLVSFPLPHPGTADGWNMFPSPGESNIPSTSLSTPKRYSAETWFRAGF